MYSPYQLAIKYFNYYLTASNGKGHGIHSPFVFELVTKVLNDKNHYADYEPIELLRKKLLQNKTVLRIEDFGAGSTKGLSKQRTVQQIAESSLKKPKYAQLLHRLVKYFQPQQILELGTSLGITTAYLASAKKDAGVITMEGSVALTFTAERNFQDLQLNNIKVITGNFDHTLIPAISQLPEVNFVFVDGNHRKEPTLNYFQQLLEKSTDSTVIVFDDIHWSMEMEEAWETIKQHPSVTLTIDLFFIGLV
ncbi:MAG: class I SAM-dependent methyltransferase, partial [Lacibacter sp.]